MKKLIAVMLSLMLIMTMLVGCGEKEQKMTKVRVNEVTHSIFYAPMYLAVEKGFFADEGIDIEITNGGGSNVSMTAVVSGQAEVGLVGPETAVYVYNEGKSNYPLVFGQLTKRDGSFLIGHEEKADFKWSNLEGKEIIAGRKGGLPAMTLEYLLNKKGLIDGKNITLNFDVAFPVMASAFESGIGDYTTLFEPAASSFCNADKGNNLVAVGSESGEVPYTCFVASKDYIESNPEIIESFLRAVYRAIDYMKTADTQEIALALAPQFSGNSLIDIENSVKSYVAIDAYMTNMAMTEDSFDRLQDIMENAKMLDERADYDKLIYNDLADKVYKEIME